ncbi:MAG: 50S ribosomal protein L22 [Candidatus Tectomicrobia bacterium]|nr:50S ribosomal protein L22 [Candidatus Tectomicrobia bacterium]
MSKATLKHYRGKPRKTRLLADLIRGKRASEALTLLGLSTASSAKTVAKVLRSALANATDRGQADDPESLIVQRVTVDQGPTLKRFRARARGRVNHIRKRSCHIQVVLGESK